MARRTGARVDAAERDARALELRAAGASFRQISAQLGISVSTAWACVDRGLAATRHEPSSKLRTLERERLDHLTAQAEQVLTARHVVVSGGKIITGGDGRPLVDHGPTLAAINSLRGLMERRARLEGLDAPTKTEIRGALSIDTLDSQIAELEYQLAADDPNYLTDQRRGRDREQAVDRFRRAWATSDDPLHPAADPRADVGGFVAACLELGVLLLSLDSDATEAVAAAVEVWLMEHAP